MNVYHQFQYEARRAGGRIFWKSTFVMFMLLGVFVGLLAVLLWPIALMVSILCGVICLGAISWGIWRAVDALRGTRCVVCGMTASVARKSDGAYFLECRRCELSADTGYNDSSTT